MEPVDVRPNNLPFFEEAHKKIYSFCNFSNLYKNFTVLQRTDETNISTNDTGVRVTVNCLQVSGFGHMSQICLAIELRMAAYL